MLFRRPRTAPAASPLRARIGAAVAARLDADPAVRRLPTDAARMYLRPDFLSAAECDLLIRMIDADRRPSSLMSERAGIGHRTSESCDLSRWDPAVRPFDEGVADLLGLPYENGETLQGQRYAPGQRFRVHFDHFDEGEPYWDAMKAMGGQRTWTAMIYLNDVAEGGATWFPQAGVRVAPKRGLLLAWNNMAPDGAPNPATMHEGTPVVEGVKYIVTKWFREGNWLPQA